MSASPALRARGWQGEARKGAHMGVSSMSDLPRNAELGLLDDVRFDRSKNIISIPAENDVNRECPAGRLIAHGHLTGYKSGFAQSIGSGTAPCIRRSMAWHTPSVGLVRAACAGRLRAGVPHREHVDRHLPKTARRVGRVGATPSAPTALTPFHRMGAHLAPGCAHLGKRPPPSRLLWFRVGRSPSPVGKRVKNTQHLIYVKIVYKTVFSVVN